MKKILIVNNNMKVGGVQKSLLNLLKALEGRYDVSLCLFSPVGDYMEKLPGYVKVIPCGGVFSLLGLSQGECRGLRALARGGFAALTRLFGRSFVLKIMLALQRPLPGEYDFALSFLHNGRQASFYGGVQEFVLEKVWAKRKGAMLHCDYRTSGANNPAVNAAVARFDCIGACSEGCREAFLSVLPELREKCVTVRNCHDFEEIRTLAEDRPVAYSGDALNILMVSRLAHEKGVERAIEAVALAREQGLAVRLHLVGSGAMEAALREQVREKGLEEAVVFHGQQAEPYRWMKNADLLLMTSYHEAAPMVIDEARSLSLPVLTSDFSSAEEMTSDCGWVCENSQEAINAALLELLGHPERIGERREALRGQEADNSRALAQFEALVEPTDSI